MLENDGDLNLRCARTTLFFISAETCHYKAPTVAEPLVRIQV